MLLIFRKLATTLFSPSRYLSRVKLYFRKEKNYKGKRYRVDFQLEIERTDKNAPPEAGDSGNI